MDPDHFPRPRRAPSSEPFITRRGSVEDADSSPTRKRPRLDSGERFRSKSVDSSPSSDPDNSIKLLRSAASGSDKAAILNRGDSSPTIKSPRPPSRVTLNLRSQPAGQGSGSVTVTEPLSQAMRAQTEGDDGPASDTVCDGERPETPQAEEKSTASTASPGSPVIEVVSEGIDEEAEEHVVEIDGDDEETADAVFENLPYLERFRSKEGVMEAIYNHVQDDSTWLDFDVLLHLSQWIDGIPIKKGVWLPLFSDNAGFWDQFGNVVTKLLQRRNLSDQPRADDIHSLRSFLNSFVRVLLRLISIDVENLESLTPAYTVPGRQGFYCTKHLRAMRDIYRTDLVFFEVLERAYHQDVEELRTQLADLFVSAIDGLFNLARFVSLGIAAGKFSPFAMSCSFRVLDQVTTRISRIPPPISATELGNCAHIVYHAFQTLDSELQDVSRSLPIDISKDLILYGSRILQCSCVMNPRLAQDLVVEYLGDGAQFDNPEYFPALVANTWKFKLFKKYISKGRMELRVACMTQLDADLVNVWQEYKAYGSDHPVMQYISEFLIDERVIDYILGVDSHPQLISRAGNIIGFLIMTNRYGDQQADTIWQTVRNSADPRVVAATLQTLKHLIGLMTAPQSLLHVVGQLHDLPIEAFTIEALALVRDLYARLHTAPINWITLSEKNNPYTLLIRLIQEASPGPYSTLLTNQVYAEACEIIKRFARVTPLNQRAKIFRACVDNIGDQNAAAGASIHALTVIANQNIPEDADILLNHLELARYLIPEICAFANRERMLNPTSFQQNAMSCRLDLVAYIILNNPASIPDDLYLPLWEHLVGDKAINNTMRDFAWKKFCQLAQQSLTDEFVTRIFTELIPSLQPIFFTMGFYEFVFDTTDGPMRNRVALWEVEGEVLKVPGAEDLWRIILTAPTGTIEEAAARLLACRYLDVREFEGVTLDVIEATHSALFNRCLDQLLGAYVFIRSESHREASSSKDLHVEELRYIRTLLFMGIFVQIIRTRPGFAPSPRHDSKVAPVDDGPIRGKPILIQYQVHDGHFTGQKKSLTVGEDETLRDLKDRLSRVIGFSSFRAIGGGVPLDLDSEPSECLKTIENKVKWLLIRRDIRGDQPKPEEKLVLCSKFESEVMAHFQEIYDCMDSEDNISEATFNFLRMFSAPESAADAVMSDSRTAAEIFPPEKAFRAKYACRALDARLKELLSKGIVDDVFLSRCIHLLEAALIGEQFLGSMLEKKHDNALAALFVETLLAFLKERPSKEVSLAYFSNEELLIERLVTFLKIMIKLPQGLPTVCNCYSTIIEASLHSRKVWETFIKREDFREMHLELLLKSQRPALRIGIARSIEALCGDLPITSSLTAEEICTHFWNVIQSILPETVNYPKQSAELFAVAELVFIKFDETSTRDEEALRAILADWSEVLLSYKHEEFVGRDEVDNVVLGFTKLLHCCVRSLKSFKRPLNSLGLMKQLFKTYLFVLPDDQVDATESLPVLESSTRKGLYDLVLALCEDSDCHNQLIYLLNQLSIEDSSSPTYAFDRANEIRSSTGYVGLYNPRNICYMNSILTQLFMNREFRRFMLSIRVPESAQTQLLSETQRLFALMQDGYLKAADPRNFAKSVRGLDNQPIDITIQMDADEFYNLLFDQWEAQMFSDAAREQFRSFYGGHTVNQIKSKECKHVSEKVEDFFVVQCDVKGKTSLQESLQSFVEGDVMEGDNKYRCESCGGRLVDAVKRTCLKDVPDNLIFHLKRFDFDLTNMTRCKIDDLFEFPERIDVGPYKVEHLNNPDAPSTPDMFQLVGVLVHQGTADGGHYYSFIRERPSLSPDSPVWLDFNDREVSDIQAHQISSMSFGGWYEDPYHGVPKQKSFNAYMLFYQRTSAMAFEQQQFAQNPDPGPPKVPVPEELSRDVTSENEQIVRSHCLFDEHHSAFVRQVFEHQRMLSHGSCREDHKNEKATIFVVMEHIRQVVSRTRDLPELDTLNGALKRRMQGCNMCCKIFLDYFAFVKSALEDLLLRCTYPRMRGVVRNLILEALLTLRQRDSTLYGADVSMDVMDATDLQISDNGALSTVVAALSLVVRHRLTSHTRVWDDLFDVLYNISSWGLHEAALLLKQGLLQNCLTILALTPDTKSQYPILSRLASRKRPIYNKLIQLMYSLLFRVDLEAASEDYPDDRIDGFNPKTRKFSLTTDELRELKHWDPQDRCYSVITRMIDLWTIAPGGHSPFVPGDILTLILGSDTPFLEVELIHASLKFSIMEYEAEYITPFIRASSYFCRACRDARYVVDLIGTVVNVAKKLQQSAGEEAVQFFSNLAQATEDGQARLEAVSPDFLYQSILQHSLVFGPNLLVYDDDHVRRHTATLLQYLFRTRPMREPVLSFSSRRSRFTILRRLIVQILKKLRHEREADTPRHYIEGAMSVVDDMLQVMLDLAQTDDPEDEEFKKGDETEFVARHRSDLDILVSSWPEEDSTALSAADYAEVSDYEDSEDDVSYLHGPS